MDIPIKLLTETAKVPTKTHNSDAAYDLYSDQNITIPTLYDFIRHGFYIDTRVIDNAYLPKSIIKTSISIAIPEGYAGLIWDRSGMGAKHNIHRFAGVIDAGYRGEIMVALYNFGSVPFEIKRGDRIAQMVIQEIPDTNFVLVNNLPNSEREDRGFGSSGK